MILRALIASSSNLYNYRSISSTSICRVLSSCTISMFGRLNQHELNDFIMARQSLEEPEFKAKSNIPKKGTVDDANNGIRYKILIAYELRSTPHNIPSVPDDDDDDAEGTTVIDGNNPSPRVVTLGGEVIVKPSELLSDDQWVSNITEVFHLDGCQFVEQEMKDKADQLMNILADRFQPYVKRRIQEPSKHTHWCLKLALKNLAVVAAHMVLSDHVKEDLRCL